ncbi:Lysine-specific demethylase 3B [Morus notabilis]|uniref:Lysine-specific demethylase 3B n=1 Tax=Morus notabilis TaxID=981085 RepID=W9RAW8_9ROSA|nr:Lysine-specific demethylase 3B [Morus notabilis]
MDEDEALPDHLRCNRTDGRQWRCKRRVMDNLKLCEIHYLQGRHRQYKEKVPESLKLQRKTTAKKKEVKGGDQNRRSVKIRAKKVEILAKLMKRKRSGETLRKMKRMKRGNAELELIRMVLKREVEKSTEKRRKDKEEVVVEDESEEELTRDLPNGLMAISSSPSPSPRRGSGNVGSDSPCRVKTGADFQAVPQRRFRSKNSETIPIGKLQTFMALHRQPLGICFIGMMIRYFDTQEEVKEACPVCRRTCTCKDCLENPSKDTESKDFFGEKHKGEVILFVHYLICMLLPLLKQINRDQNDELEIEARTKGQKSSTLHIKQAETGCNERQCCNRCKASILDLHRTCPNCSYNLCLSCCRDLHHGGFYGGTDMPISMYSNKKKTRMSRNTRQIEKKPIRTRKNSSKDLALSVSLPHWKAQNDNAQISCPPRDFGGCGESLLELRCLFPLSFTRELEVSAEELVCSYDFPDTSDIQSCCSICLGTNQKAKGIKQLQEAAVREGSSDNFLYYPTLLEIHGDNFEHFQKHWLKGHPVIVRNVLQATSHLSWDPVLMFCAYLERSISRYEDNRDTCEVTNRLDWCEVEIGIRQYFMGSFKGETHKNTWSESLKLKGWLSSQLFQQQFPAHFAEIIHTLPLQEYMNPASGLLNLAARLPQEIPKPDLGPCLYISYGYAEQLVQADSVIKLCYDSCDMVNILAHTSDVPISAEQVSKVRKLLKKHKAQTKRLSSKVTSDQNLVNKDNTRSSLNGEKIKDMELRDIIGEEMHLRKRIARVSCSSAATNGSCDRNLKESSMSRDVESVSDSDFDTDCGTINEFETPEDKKSFGAQIESSNRDCKKPLATSSRAHWDVFRKQDVPKLKEYLRRHSHEFACLRDFQKHVVHPIFDQSFFLDTTHKMRLKEEFEIEPWSFEQRVGEAVIIPAGCPYQIRSPKSCVHVVLDFMSPENVNECVQLTDEIRLLPDDHKAKVDKLEVRKMALHSISTAIKEIRELTCAT